MEPFAFLSGGEWTDPTRNSHTRDVINGCVDNPPVSACGHHFRVWPAKDPSGNLMPGSYLFAMDYGSSPSVNYDFQDNVYLVQNVQPAAGGEAPEDVPLDPVDPGPVLYRLDTGAPSGSVYTDSYGRRGPPTATCLPEGRTPRRARRR